MRSFEHEVRCWLKWCVLMHAAGSCSSAGHKDLPDGTAGPCPSYSSWEGAQLGLPQVLPGSGGPGQKAAPLVLEQGAMDLVVSLSNIVVRASHLLVTHDRVGIVRVHVLERRRRKFRHCSVLQNSCVVLRKCSYCKTLRLVQIYQPML